MGKGRVCLGDPVESMPKPGTKRAIVDCAADFEQLIDAISRPSHLLRLVHASVHQEVRRAFGDRRSDPFTGTVLFGIADKPCGLATEILFDRMQRVHSLRDGTPFAPCPCSPLNTCMTLRMILRLAVPNAPVQTFEFGDDHSLRRHPISVVSRQISRRHARWTKPNSRPPAGPEPPRLSKDIANS
jgi:hypothetical protein